MRLSWIGILVAAAALPAMVAIGQDAVAPPVPDSAPAQNSVDVPAPACSRNLLASYDPNKGEFFGHNVPVWDVENGNAVMFQSGMTIDADGAPNAYNPDNTGLDDLANAGEPGHWGGIVADGDGEPLVQGPDDPYPGYYISCTSLADWTKPFNDPSRYVDASKIPYIVLPGELSRQIGARLGDFAVVVNARNGNSAYAIFADIGTMGEGSVALANQLGIWSDARRGGTRGGILYLVYPGSGNHHPRSLDEINSETGKLFESWGGMKKLSSCTPEQPIRNQLADKNFH